MKNKVLKKLNPRNNKIFRLCANLIKKSQSQICKIMTEIYILVQVHMDFKREYSLCMVFLINFKILMKITIGIGNMKSHID